MKTFKDKEGKEWQIEINVTTAGRVKAMEDGIDLLSLDPEVVFGRLKSDAYLLVNVLYMLCKDEADKRQVTDEQFGRLLIGDAIEGAVNAMMESLIDFFPKARRETLQRAWQKINQIEVLATGKAVQMIDEMDANELLRKAFGGSSTSSPELSA